MSEKQINADQEFDNFWAQKIKPGLASYADEYHRKKKQAVLGVVIGVTFALLLVGYIYILGPIGNQVQHGAIVLLLIVIGGGGALLLLGPFSKLESLYSEFLRETIISHFGQSLAKPASDETARDIADRLSDLKMIQERGARKISNHYVSTYRDCHIDMSNLEVKIESGAGQNRSTSTYDYWIVEIGVPMPFDGEVQIRRDYGGLLNTARNNFVKGKQVNFPHPAFEERYEVYAEDAELAYQLISPEFCDNLLAMDTLLPSTQLGRVRPLTGLFQNGKFVLVVNEFGDVFETGSVAPTKVEGSARRLIARMNLPFQIVDYLHGDR